MNQGMIKKMQKLQKEMMQTQKELENSVFQGTAGGVVTVEMKGTKEVVSVTINPDAIDPEDAEMLQDTIMAAFNNAAALVDKTTEEKMSKYTAGLGGFGF